MTGLYALAGPNRSPEQQQEYDQCVASAEYFIDTYCMLKSDSGSGLVRFRLFDYQKNLLRDFQVFLETIVLKARQLGITELLAAYSVWKTLKDHQDVIIVSQGEDEATEFVKKALICWENLPHWLRVPLINPNKLTSMEFQNRSRILPKPATSRAGRSYNAQLLIFDEWAHQLFQEAIYAAAAPTALSAGNQIIGVSTANGAGNMFHRQWERAVDGTGAHPVFLPYNVRPGRDEHWLSDRTKTMESWQRAQEFPSSADEAFILSGRPRFDQDALSEIMADTTDPVTVTQLGAGPDGRPAGYLRVWENPQHSHAYVIGADTSEGLAKGDFSCAVVIDRATGLDVAELHGHWDTAQFAAHLSFLGLKYNKALLAPERNNHGHSVLQALVSTEHYPDDKIYRHVEYDNHRKKVINRPMGWVTSSLSKPIMVDDLGKAILERRHYRNRGFVSEARTYTLQDDGDTGASGSCYDDRVIAYAIAEQLRRVPSGPSAPIIPRGVVRPSTWKTYTGR